MLSRHEQRRLDEIEQQLMASDPALAAMLLGGSTSPKTRRWKAGSLASGLLGVFLTALGATTVTFTLIFAGILALAIAACMHVTRSRGAG
ncbi:DUF3040 domain-containing protein [Saccharothrix deserti]|uniref:DUF3040 domain-containing protein n=1 Tax=Saccharothrix deserti TaxID=2593674 RepID=UPI00131A7B48|nr:DUF3040 domain-containing protein [Saccharothrix deserti]